MENLLRTFFKPPKPAILVVDDDEKVLHAFKRQAYTHFDVTINTSPASALTAIERGTKFTAVLGDYKMPVIDGLDFLSRVKLASPSTSIFLFTGVLDLPDMRERIANVGVNGTFFKPIHTMAVVATLNAHIALKQKWA